MKLDNFVTRYFTALVFGGGKLIRSLLYRIEVPKKTVSSVLVF